MIKRLLLAILALVPMCAMAQVTTGFGPFDGGQNTKPPKPAWEQFKLPNKTMKLDFRNASPDAVLSLFSKTSGITIIKDPAMTKPITVTSPKAVPLKDAFQILNTVLGMSGFSLQKEGSLMTVRPKQQQQPQFQLPPGFQMPQQGSGSEVKVYPIKYANASAVARVVNEVYGQQNQNQFNPFGGMVIRMDNGQPQQQGRGPTVRASADDFSNSVIVNAPGEQQKQVETLILQIDKQTEDPQKAKVYKLEFAEAATLAPAIQNVLTNTAPKGRGGIGNQNVPFEQRFQQAARFGSSAAGFGTVATDDRTNSLIVTTTDENHLVVEQVIKELDTEIKVETSTFVFPLDNARADDMADLLGQAFGSRNNGSFGNFGRNNGRNNQNRNNQNRNNQNRGGGGGNRNNAFGGRAPTEEQLQDDKNLWLNLQDPEAQSGDLETQVGVNAQFFGFGGGGFGGQGGRNQGQPQFGRDANGRLINVQDLTNQVTVIPDPNTNSLIVVTSPENAEVIRQILSQLDKIPEQVMIETIIVEATLDSSSKLGVDWKFTQSPAFGNTGTSGTVEQNLGVRAANDQGFRYTLTGGNLELFINALKSDRKFQVLSTPRIFTSNNVEAEINISQRVPFVVSQREDANGNLTFNYDFEDVGIVLTVTPRITANGYVSMDVEQTANDLQGFTDFNAPIVNQRIANTTVAVKDGETIILGGIIRNTVQATTRKIPILGDIPILGNLFKSTSKDTQKTELLVFLTPRVVRDPDEARRLREEQEGQLSPMSKQQLDGVKKLNGNQNNGGGQQGNGNGNPPKEGRN